MARTALIVGAGIGGLAAGVALRRAGWHVRIFERADSPRELGFGVLLAANALAALRELGVAEAVTSRAAPTAHVEIRRTDGRVLRRLNVQVGGPSVVALRPDLHGALLSAVGPESLRLGSEAVSFTQTQDGVVLTLSDGTTEAGTVLIGADGVHSCVRRQLHPRESPPRASGFAAVRGVAYGVTSQLGDLSGVGYFDDGLEVATVRAGSDAVYWYMSLLTRDAGPAPTADSVVHARTAAFEPPLRAILTATGPEDMRYDELFERDPLPTWGAGHVTLLGVAAHPVLPHTGQGAAQALEDAVALGLALAGRQPIDHALRQYEAVRSQRTRAFIKLGPRLARVTTTHSMMITTMRNLAVRLLPESVFARSTVSLSRDPHLELRSTP
ncbi:MAG TPA: FAD-dependent monooxygenase [Vicinamibacterales bacterium]|nr:FAD-dependent monooxygenase [Vicinamibacterales bacterium]